MTKKMPNRISINYLHAIFAFGLVCIVIISAYMGFTTYMNLDGNNALHEASVLFSGGKYFYDFYETTPPMFLYLYYPIVETLKYIGSNHFYSVFFYYYVFISFVSLSICHILTKKIFSPSVEIYRISFLLIIAAVLLIQMPCFFGEREHTALILTLPYFLLLSLRVDTKNISTTLCVVIAMISGIGFSIKPQFCIGFFLSEIYLLLRLKKFSGFIRIENTIILFVFLIYFLSTYILFPEYFRFIIPQAMSFYYQGIASTTLSFLKLPTFIFSLFIIVFYMLEYKNIHLKSLSQALLIGQVGFTLTYFSELDMWEYHFFPAYSLTLLLGFVLICRFIMNNNTQTNKRLLYILLLVLFYGFYHTYHFTDGNFNYYLVSIILFFSVVLFAQKFIWNTALRILSGVGLFLMIFTYPGFTDTIGYQHFKQEKAISEPLVNFIHQYAYHQTVYFLASTLEYEYPTVDYGGGIHVSRFPYLMWMPSYIKQMLKNPNDSEGLKLKGIYQYFMKLLSEDIALKKPTFIFLDTSKQKKTISFQATGVNYRTLFLRTPEFKAVWDHYHYFKTINNQPYYQFNVYELNK